MIISKELYINNKNKGGIVKERNYSKMRLMGIYTTLRNIMVTEEEESILNEACVDIKKVLDTWDSVNKSVGIRSKKDIPVRKKKAISNLITNLQNK